VTDVSSTRHSRPAERGSTIGSVISMWADRMDSRPDHSYVPVFVGIGLLMPVAFIVGTLLDGPGRPRRSKVVRREKLIGLVIGIGDITTKRVLPVILSEPRSRLAGVVTRDPAKAEPYSVPAWTDLGRCAGRVRCGRRLFRVCAQVSMCFARSPWPWTSPRPARCRKPQRKPERHLE
jgi:hypothetical protein